MMTGSFDRPRSTWIGQPRRESTDDFAIGLEHAVFDRGRGHDQFEAELVSSSCSSTISVWRRPRKPQRKPKPKRGRGLGLVAEGGVVQPELLHGLAKLAVLVWTLDGVEAREHHEASTSLKPGSGSDAGVLVVRRMVSPILVWRPSLDACHHRAADSARACGLRPAPLRSEDPEAFYFVAASDSASAGSSSPASVRRRQHGPGSQRRGDWETGVEPRQLAVGISLGGDPHDLGL